MQRRKLGKDVTVAKLVRIMFCLGCTDGAGASPGDVQYPMFPSLSNMPATR